MCDDFFGDRVQDAIAVFFDFNDEACIVVMGKGLENRDGRGICEFQVNDMMQRLAPNVAGGMVVDELSGAS